MIIDDYELFDYIDDLLHEYNLSEEDQEYSFEEDNHIIFKEIQNQEKIISFLKDLNSDEIERIYKLNNE